jgi:hypothetical protein
MLNTILGTRWILGVAGVGAKLDKDLAAAQHPDQRINAVRRSDIHLLRFDPDLVARAQTNAAHFLLARRDSSMTLEEYMQLATGPGSQLNAVATYSWYHQKALAKAARIARGELASSSRDEDALAVLADEAFALHFLEDGFAGGHAVGNWGNDAVRKGTHDYYNKHGVEVETWNGSHFVAFGDAYMTREDETRVAAAVGESLAQLAEALQGKLGAPAGFSDAEAMVPEAFDTCNETHSPQPAASSGTTQTLLPVVIETPVPALGDVPGQLPRFRSEFGPFLGTSTATRVALMSGGFAPNQSGASINADLEAAVRVGLGLEDVLDESGDGLVFAGIGYRQDSATLGTATVPTRGAITVRVRAPFWLIPGDIVVASPVLALISPRTLKGMGIRAANGGLIPWQSGFATPIGRFQFVLGREAGLSFFRMDDHNPMVVPTQGVPLGHTLVALSSIEVEFPILEYRPVYTFSMKESSSVDVQFYSGFDVPTGYSVVSPANAPIPHLHTIAVTGIRIAFDWRRYLR